MVRSFCARACSATTPLTEDTKTCGTLANWDKPSKAGILKRGEKLLRQGVQR